MRIKKNINSKISLIAYLIANGISIPHYCYHNDLSIAGNCRVCLVELKNSIKPVVSCATNAKTALHNNNMYHDSALVKKARENILEFLLLNHPLDCPICDQGGDCDLQDQSLFFGFSKRRFYKFKRVTNDKDLGPIVKTVMTRCIHCTRCVRFTTEISGVEELGIFGRGVNSEIGTYIDAVLSSELSGNIIDLCPVGALTLKSFPFELRGWDIEKLESIDPTDSFGSYTRVYVSKNKVVQVEPEYNINSSNTWLTDKGRQFFDGIFGTWDNLKNIPSSQNNYMKKNQWLDLINLVLKTSYIFEYCQIQQYKKKFFTIVFENLSLEMISLLNILNQTKTVIRIKRAENLKINNDLEAFLQLNNVKPKLIHSTLCFLISTNPRYEGYCLNLNLRQKHLKGNFKCFMLGSLINLTFPVSFLGSNLSILTSITEGNNLICQDFKNSKNPLIVSNYELFKRIDGKNILQLLKHLNCQTSFKNNLNVLSPSLFETGTQILNKFLPLTEKDLLFVNSFYFLNINLNTISNLKKIFETKLLKNFITLINKKSIIINQNYRNDGLKLINKLNNKNYDLLSSMFYENEGTFINTEGFTKRTNKLIFKKETKTDWQILRKILKHLNINSNTTNSKNIFFFPVKLTNFKTYINFQYQTTQILTNLNFYLNTKNKTFIINKNYDNFKQNKIKLQNTKLKFWLDDFYQEGKDGFSQNSFVLSNCSKILRNKHNNFLSINAQKFLS